MSMIEIQPELDLPADARVLLVSDVHLGDGSPGDLFGKKDDLFLAMLAAEGGAVDAVVINGDAIDHMQARSTKRMERAHPRVFEALRALAAKKRVVYVLGNHEDPRDLREAFPDFAYVDALTVGGALCITHGHQFDLHWKKSGGGFHALARFHSFLETHGKQPIRQPFRDYVNWPNRVVHRLFFRYTQALRAHGALRRALGDQRHYEHWKRVDNFWARGQWGDLGCIFQNAEAFLRNGSPWSTLVLGHSHQPGVVAVGPQRDRTYANTGSWAIDLATYGRVERGRVSIFDARSGRALRDERYKKLLEGADLPDMAGWFARYYRPFFRYDLEAIRRDFPPYDG